MGAFCIYPDKYRPRQPKSTPLFRLLNSHYEEFRNVYDESFSKRYGFWRPVTDEVVEKYLRCGDDVFVIAGGYTLQNVADGVTFDNYLELTGLDIEDESGFALAADLVALADAYDLNSETDDIVDFEDLGFMTMSGTADGAVIQFNASIDFGSGNPFAIIIDTGARLALESRCAPVEEPAPDDLPPVVKDLSI